MGIEQLTGAIGPVLTNANKLIDNLNGTVTNLNGTVTSVKSDLGLFLPKLSPVAETRENRPGGTAKDDSRA